MMNVFRYERPLPGTADYLQFWDTIVGLCTVTRWDGMSEHDPILANTVALLVHQMLMRPHYERKKDINLWASR